MKLDRRRMEQAVSQNIITPAQAEELWAFWQSQRHDTPHFTFIHVLYYLGGMIAIAAMTLFVTIGFMQFGSGFVAVVSAVYAALAVGLAEYFQKKGMPIPSGICATLAVALVPLFVFTVQDMLGYWPSGTLYRDYHTWIDWRWLHVGQSFCSLPLVSQSNNQSAQSIDIYQSVNATGMSRKG